MRLWLVVWSVLLLVAGCAGADDDPGAPTPPITIVPPVYSPTPLPVSPRPTQVGGVPTILTLPTTTVQRGGNMRSAPRLTSDTVLAQVCPGDVLAVLGELEAGDVRWIEVRVLNAGEPCSDSRPRINDTGWVSSVLLGPIATAAPIVQGPAAVPAETRPPPAIATAVPFTPTPTARSLADSGRLIPLNGWLVTEESPPVALSGDGRLVARGSLPDGDGTLQLWTSADGTLLQTLAWDAPQYHVALNNDGSRLAASLGNSVVAVWDTAIWRLAGMLIPPQASQGAVNPTGLAFSSDSVLLACEVANGIALWDLNTSTLLRVLPTPLRQTRLSFAPDGRLLAIASATGGTTEVWQVSDGTLRYTLPVAARQVAFPPDGTRLAVAAEGLLAMYQPDDGAQITVLDPDSTRIEALAFDAAGELLATAPAFHLNVWRVRDGQLAADYEVSLNALAFTADGRELVGVLGAAGVVRRWTVGGSTAPIPADAPLEAAVIAPSSLYREARAQGENLPQLCPGDRVALLERRGDWWQVRVVATDGATCASAGERVRLRAAGWLSRRVLQEPAATPTAP